VTGLEAGSWRTRGRGNTIEKKKIGMLGPETEKMKTRAKRNGGKRVTFAGPAHLWVKKKEYAIKRKR